MRPVLSPTQDSAAILERSSHSSTIQAVDHSVQPCRGQHDLLTPAGNTSVWVSGGHLHGGAETSRFDSCSPTGGGHWFLQELFWGAPCLRVWGTSDSKEMHLTPTQCAQGNLYCCLPAWASA